MTFILWFSVFTGLCILFGFILRPWRHKVPFKTLFLPGVLASGLARYLGCLMTGTEVKKVNLFWAEGPTIEHAHSRIPVAGPAWIAFFPFIVSVVLLFFADHILEQPVPFPYHLPQYEEAQVSPAVDVFVSSVKAVPKAPLSEVRTWLFLYLTLAFFVGAAPGTKDLQYLSLGVGILYLVVWQASIWGSSTGSFAHGWWSIWNPTGPAWPRLSLFTGLIGIAILGTALVVGITTLTKKASEREEPNPTKA